MGIFFSQELQQVSISYGAALFPFTSYYECRYRYTIVTPLLLISILLILRINIITVDVEAVYGNGCYRRCV